MLSPTKNTQYAYIILLFIRSIISLHVGYRYISYSSEAVQAKGGTFVEATTEKVNYLPYVTSNDADIFYQSLLFHGCVYPSFSGTSITYREEACTVTTTDYKSFVISPNQLTRSDGTPLTLNDIFFTYNTLLKENYRNIGSLENYSNISIVANETDNNIKVTFPNASIDNMNFFTNFILPAHILANTDLSSYIARFYSHPVGTNCAKISSGSTNDTSNTVFDLSACEDVPLKYYQVKHFPDEEELTSYIMSNPESIDIIMNNNASYPGFTENKVLLNKFSTIFFNTTRSTMTDSLRQQLASLFSKLATNNVLEDYIVPDQYVLNAFNPASRTGLQEQLQNTTTPTEPSIPISSLPDTLSFSDDTRTQEYVLEEAIEDKKPLLLSFDKPYDKISVTFNKGVEYYPESYDAEEQISYYNLNPTFRNITTGRNLYTIKAYDGDTHINTFELIVNYMSEPTSVHSEATPPSLTNNTPLQIVYFSNEINTVVAQLLETTFKQHNISDHFIFMPVEDPEIFAGKLQSKEYDIIISNINLGLRKDISSLFVTNTPTINPSLYTNTDLSTAIHDYFLTHGSQQAQIKDTIDQLYRAQAPFVLLGKELSKINIAQRLEFPYPLKMYVLGWRKDFVNQLPIFHHIDINWDRVWQYDNFKNFLASS